MSWLAAGMLALWAYAYLPWLGTLDLQFEEPRRALIAQTMLQTGEYWTPELAGEPYTAKPPLYNWLIAASATLNGGFTEWSARLPSVLCVLILALLFVWGARDRIGRSALVFLGLGLLLAPEILAKGRIAEIEPLFALLVAASLWTWFALYDSGATGIKLWLLPLALVALAYLTKREPAVVFFYFAVGPFLLLRGQWRRLVEPGHVLAVAAALALISVWLTGMASEAGWQALWDTLRREVLERGLSGQTIGDIARHVVTYPLAVLVALLPFSAMLPLLAMGAVRRQTHARFGDLFVFSVIAVLANLPVYWFRGDIAVRYFLPMFPFILLIAALVYDVLCDGLARSDARIRRYIRVLSIGVRAVAALCALLLLASIALPRFIDGHEPLMPAPVAAALAILGGIALWQLKRRAADSPMPTLLLSICAVLVLGRGVYFNVVLADRVNRYAEERNAPLIAANLREVVGRDSVVYALGVPWAVWYYADGVRLTALETAARPGSWMLVLETERPVAAALGFPAEPSARFTYRDEVLLLGRAPD